MSRGQKWARFEKKYLSSDWTSDIKIWIAGEAGGIIFVQKGISNKSNVWLSYKMVKKKLLIVVPYFLCLTVVNWMTKSDHQGGITYNLFKMNIFLLENFVAILAASMCGVSELLGGDVADSSSDPSVPRHRC